MRQEIYKGVKVKVIPEYQEGLKVDKAKYKKLVNSKKWAELTKSFRQKECFICNTTKRQLCLHHLDYTDIENPETMITLCQRCHRKIHFVSKRRVSLKNHCEAVKRRILMFLKKYGQKKELPFILKRFKETEKIRQAKNTIKADKFKKKDHSHI